MGLGKTVQTVALVAALAQYKACDGPHLILAPKAVLPNWVRCVTLASSDALLVNAVQIPPLHQTDLPSIQTGVAVWAVAAGGAGGPYNRLPKERKLLHENSQSPNGHCIATGVRCSACGCR